MHFFTFLDLKVINPLENLDEKSIYDMENLVQNYYELVKTSNIRESDKLLQFHEFDMQNYLNENGSLDIDLKKKLKLD